jgi:hypothetical protein
MGHESARSVRIRSSRPSLRRPLRLVTRPERALSGAFIPSKDQLRARAGTHAQDRSEPSSLCARMRRASSSNFDGTSSSAGPTGNGSSAPSPTSCTGILSASSRPFAISASTKDEVHSTETRSSLTRSSWHVGSSPRDFAARATAHDVRLRTARTSSGKVLAVVRVWVNAPEELHQVEGRRVAKAAGYRGVVSGKNPDLEVVTQLWVRGFDTQRLREGESEVGVVLDRP